jgi:rubrerythrin
MAGRVGGGEKAMSDTPLSSKEMVEKHLREIVEDYDNHVKACAPDRLPVWGSPIRARCEVVEAMRAFLRAADEPSDVSFAIKRKFGDAEVDELILALGRNLRRDDLRQTVREWVERHSTAEPPDVTLEKDAARYRWLRHGDNDEQVICDEGGSAWMLRMEQLDEAIDIGMHRDATTVTKSEARETTHWECKWCVNLFNGNWRTHCMNCSRPRAAVETSEGQP